MMNTNCRSKKGFSLMELLAVVTILGIIAAIIVPRVSVSSSTARTQVHNHNMATINSAVERWYIEKGSWPADVDALSADTDYFPDGIPVNPVTGNTYQLNANHRAEDSGSPPSS